jgi:hypothetical protein
MLAGNLKISSGDSVIVKIIYALLGFQKAEALRSLSF